MPVELTGKYSNSNPNNACQLVCSFGNSMVFYRADQHVIGLIARRAARATPRNARLSLSEPQEVKKFLLAGSSASAPESREPIPVRLPLAVQNGASKRNCHNLGEVGQHGCEHAWIDGGRCSVIQVNRFLAFK